jgi:hypothetical protein
MFGKNVTMAIRRMAMAAIIFAGWKKSAEMARKRQTRSAMTGI